MKALVIAASGVHLGYLGCYGNDWIATPTLDRLAAEGVVFDQHFADRPDPGGAWHAWRRGRYEMPTAGAKLETSSKDEDDLIRMLRDRGTLTCLVGNQGSEIPEQVKLIWDRVSLASKQDGADERLSWVLQAVSKVLAYCATHDDWLLWLDLSTLLPPWPIPKDEEGSLEGKPEPGDKDRDPPSDLHAGPIHSEDRAAVQRLQSAYAHAVAYLDSLLASLLDELSQRNLLEETLLVFTSDRGVALGEHDTPGADRLTLHDEQIHLPLIIRLRGGAEAGRRVFALTQPVDLMVSLLEFFGIPRPPGTHGRSLWPLIRGEARQVRGYACAGLQAGEVIEWALRTPEWAFLLPVCCSKGNSRRPQLYVKPDDRWEVNNVLQHHLELAEHFEEVLHDFVTASLEPGLFQPPVLRDIEAEQISADSGIGLTPRKGEADS